MFVVNTAVWNEITGWKMAMASHRIDLCLTFHGSDREVLWLVPESHAADIGRLLSEVMPEKRKP